MYCFGSAGIPPKEFVISEGKVDVSVDWRFVQEDKHEFKFYRARAQKNLVSDRARTLVQNGYYGHGVVTDKKPGAAIGDVYAVEDNMNPGVYTILGEISVGTSWINV